jgi:hypothetical protein
MKQWIVYVTPDNKVEAVECNHSGLQEEELTREHNVIVGTPAFKLKSDAIDYIKQVAL